MGKFNAEKIQDFARFYGFSYDSIDPHSLVKDVLVDMTYGLEGKKSSLPMIPSYITPVSNIPAGKTVLALDAGGTNLRVSLIEFTENGQAIPKETKKTHMPGTKGKLTEEQFFNEIADAALPIVKDAKIEGIGFTFSYPMEITKDADGILMAFAKEVDAPDVIGKSIGAGLRKAFASKGFKYDGNITLLNDTVATLLSGYVSIPQTGVEPVTKNDFTAVPGPVIGFILGTGFNTAYPESVIPKIGFNNPDNPQIIVCESGGFEIRYLGKLDKEFDALTLNPGDHLLEKTTSGAYLGPLTLHIVKQAIKDKLFTFEKSEELLNKTHLETKVLNDFLLAPLSATGLGALFKQNELDAIASIHQIATLITERGGLFSAAALAATVLKIDTDFEPYSPVRIAVEGTTFHAFKGLKRSIDAWLHQLLIFEKHRPYVVAPVEQASLFGAAVAALSKK